MHVTFSGRRQITRREFVGGIGLGIGAAAIVPAVAKAQAASPKQSRPLFNGRDLSGFYTFVKGFGRNSDPKGVFSVRDGAIYVSGEIDGYLCTPDEHENYRLVVEYKWGEKNSAAREGRALDSGIFLHVTGEDGAWADVWPQCYEFQVWQGTVGDLILLSGNGKRTLTVEGEQRGGFFYYQPGAPPQLRVAPQGTGDALSRVNIITRRDRDPEWQNVKGFRGKNEIEKPHGEWNTVEAICDGDTITNIVNGRVVNKATKASHSKGRIALQSEGGEIFFRNVALHPLR